jgi:hypothetical protein
LYSTSITEAKHAVYSGGGAYNNWRKPTTLVSGLKIGEKETNYNFFYNIFTVISET